MRTLVVGLGVQGKKRRHFAGADYVGAVDPFNTDANYKDIAKVPLDDYDAALCCIPDHPKKDILHFLLSNGKHVLIEKPLWTVSNDDLLALEKIARAQGAVCYTAYNHRFEPHFVRMRNLIASCELGRIYRCRMFYGNGTARLVKESQWRDQGAGVLPDLGSHLLDTFRFWFGDTEAGKLRVISANRFENRAPDHVVIGGPTVPSAELEMTLLMWRNHFTCDILAEKGTAHIRSLCKWGPSRFTHRIRVLPSGRPTEESTTLVSDDPTWAAEYAHFKRLIAEKTPADLSNDVWLQKTLRRLGQDT